MSIENSATPWAQRQEIADVLAAQERGDPLEAYDLAVHFHRKYPDHLGLKFHIILALARSGLTQKASRQFEEWKLHEADAPDIAGLAGVLAEHRSRNKEDSSKEPSIERAARYFVRAFEDVAGMGARLLKDSAWDAHRLEDRRSFAQQSAQAYAKVYEQTHGFYSGLNTATMHLLAGDRSTASATAQRVVANMERHVVAKNKTRVFKNLKEYESTTKNEMRDRFDRARVIPAEQHMFFWALAQCYLLSAEYHSIDEVLVEEIQQSRPKNLIEASTLRKQLNQIIKELSPNTSQTFKKAVDRLQNVPVPSVVHYSGHMISDRGDRQGRFLAEQEENVAERIKEELSQLHVGAGVGSLACGSDILFAEALFTRRAELHVVLPFDEEQFIETSVRRGGSGWVKRFKQCLTNASSVTYATETKYLGDDNLFGYGSDMAMGLAVLAARIYGLKVHNVAVWDRQDNKSDAGTAANIENWKKVHGEDSVHVIKIRKRRIPHASKAGVSTAANFGERREIKAILFGDIKGFSKLPEDRLRLFWDKVIKTFADTIRKYQKKGTIDFYNTWGDGLFVVVKDVEAAAGFSIELQEALKAKQEEFAEAGFPKDMALRLGGHLGPIFTREDPVLERHNWFGSEVARAARMEPVTPPGEIYVTEPFAAILALKSGLDKFRCEYDGEIPNAKGYGEFRMYRLRRVRKQEGA